MLYLALGKFKIPLLFGVLLGLPVCCLIRVLISRTPFPMMEEMVPAAYILWIGLICWIEHCICRKKRETLRQITEKIRYYRYGHTAPSVSTAGFTLNGQPWGSTSGDWL